MRLLSATLYEYRFHYHLATLSFSKDPLLKNNSNAQARQWPVDFGYPIHLHMNAIRTFIKICKSCAAGGTQIPGGFAIEGSEDYGIGTVSTVKAPSAWQ